MNRNKHKMIATVLVDMRIRGGEESGSLAPTEEQLTESEASPSEALSDFSGGAQSETMSDSEVVAEEENDGTEDEEGLHEEEAQVIRRRKGQLVK